MCCCATPRLLEECVRVMEIGSSRPLGYDGHVTDGIRDLEEDIGEVAFGVGRGGGVCEGECECNVTNLPLV